VIRQTAERSGEPGDRDAVARPRRASVASRPGLSTLHPGAVPTDPPDKDGTSSAGTGGSDDERPRRRGRLALVIIATVAVVFVLIQFVPYRVDNPPVNREPTWNSPKTRTLAVAACFDCHSNETHTYWWEDVAPLSWWITNHVKDGRAALNFSECTRSGGGENDAAETVRNGSMPPDYYTWLGLHSNAKLTAAEKQQLATGLSASLKGWNCGSGGGG
jgi:hypothetical protein